MHDTSTDTVPSPDPELSALLDEEERIARERREAPVDRVEDLKRQLAAEYEQLIEAAEARLEVVDRQLAKFTELRKQTVDDLRTHRRDVERLTGDRQDKAAPGTDGEFVCKVPGCGKSYPTSNGLKIHTGRSHKRDRIAPKQQERPMPSTSTRSVYRCGELDDVYADGVCGRELKSLADLSHHTLTDHKRQPTPAEKILVTPDR